MGNVIPRVAAIHDLSGFGKVSLTEAIPILSAMGIEVCPMPTAVLATHTYEFQNYTRCDLTEEMPKIIAHWDAIGLDFDAVYSGYMSSAKQLEITGEFMRRQKEKGALIVVDPVMGDNALLDVQMVYSDRMRDMVGGMEKLCEFADVITPNVTEACMLTGIDYPNAPVHNAEIKQLLKQLHGLGSRHVVITSVMDSENSMCVAVYDGDEDKYYKVDCGFVNRPFHGTGDVYTSVLTGALCKGMRLIDAAAEAAGFVRAAIRQTVRHPEIKIREGVLFEPVLATYFSSMPHEDGFVEI